MPSEVCARALNCHVGKLYRTFACACECVRACVCDAYHPRDQENGKVLCLYAYISGGKPPDSPLYSNSAAFSDIPARNSRPKSPGLRIPPLFRPSSRHPLSLRDRPGARPPPRAFTRAAVTLVCATSEPSYSDKIERIPPKRLRLRRPMPVPPPTRPTSRSRRRRNIYYKAVTLASAREFPRLRTNAPTDVVHNSPPRVHPPLASNFTVRSRVVSRECSDNNIARLVSNLRR